MLRLVLALSVLCLIPHSAFGYCYLATSCDGSEISLSMDVFNDLGEEYEGLEILIKQRLVGVCDSEDVIYPPGLVMPAYPSGYEATFFVPAALQDQFYSYHAYVVLPDDSLQYLAFASHEAGCGSAIAARGYLVQGSSGITIELCPDSCWEGVVHHEGILDFSLLPVEEYLPYVGSGVPVDLFGTPGPPIPMLGDFELRVSQVAPAPFGLCGPVSTEGVNWGGLKARYR